jgi:TolB protein
VSQSAILFAVLSAGLLGAPSARAVEPAGTLVFSVRTWEGDYASKDIPGGVWTTPTQSSLWSVTIGGEPKLLVKSGKSDDAPAFSPDGQWLYFQSNAAGRWELYRSKPDGSRALCLTGGDRLGKEWKDAYGCSLSADGKIMVYTVYNGSTGRVVVADAYGSEPRFVAPKLGYIYMAALSPNGDRVVFSGPAAGYRLKLVKLPDGEPIDLTPNHPESFVPRFTPDGKTIVFFRRDGDVYRVDADGKNLKRLTEGNRHVEFRLSEKDTHGSSDPPCISPDGRRIAYISQKSGVANVWTMNLDGSQQKQITFRKTGCGRVSWSPDGKQIAFVSFEGVYPQLFVISADGGEPRQLTSLKGAVYFINWKP